MLTQQQLSFYRENGFVVAPDILTPDEVRTLQKVTDDFIDQSRQVATSNDVFDVEPNHTADRPRLRRLMKPADQHPAYAATLTNPRMVGILQQILGPNVRLHGLKLNLKPGGGGEPIEWHQDWGYFPHTNDDVTVIAMMINDVDAENGPMMVVPGSHKGPVLDHHQDGVFAGAVTDPEANKAFAKAVPLTGKAGSISIHHVRTLHASGINNSDRYRPLLFITARAADAWPLAEKVEDITAFDALMMTGRPTIAPRMANVPVRLPFPRVLGPQSSIFEKQKGLRNSPFQRAMA